jgi:hypothetical protein
VGLALSLSFSSDHLREGEEVEEWGIGMVEE